MGKNTLFSVVPKLRSADGSRFVIKIAGKQTGKQKKTIKQKTTTTTTTTKSKRVIMVMIMITVIRIAITIMII